MRKAGRKMDSIKVGRNIARIRRENNLTQEKVAEALGISAPAVSRWENGHALPDISLLPELARLLDCTIDHILLADEKPNRERKQSNTEVSVNAQLSPNPEISLAEQIINMLEGRNMIGMDNQTIIKAFSRKHGNLGDVTVVRNRSTRSDRAIVSSITLKVNGRSYPLLEKILFGDMTELYRTQLLCEYGISLPLVYKIDLEEKSILLEDLSEGYISGREYDEDTPNGTIYRSAYEDIMGALAQYHMAFWEKKEVFMQMGLPWHLQSPENFRIHCEGMGSDLDTFLKLFPNQLSEKEVGYFREALEDLEKEMSSVIEKRFRQRKNITLVHGDFNPSNIFVSKKDTGNVKFIDIEAVRVGLPTEDLAMFLALHVASDREAMGYLKHYYLEVTKKQPDYSRKAFIEDYKSAIRMAMFHPIGIVGVKMHIYDEHMIKCAIKAYETFVADDALLYNELKRWDV